jgi:hypothetical protein
MTRLEQIQESKRRLLRLQRERRWKDYTVEQIKLKNMINRQLRFEIKMDRRAS